MDQNKTSELIFQKWVASLASKDRSTKTGAPANFDELFFDLKKAGVPFDEAHNLLAKAIKAHEPSAYIKKKTWEKVRAHIEVSYDDFMSEWSKSLGTCATDAFFSNYPLKLDEDDDGEPKVYGNMSVKEYRLQRKYADAFPRLNTDDLVRQMKERQSLSENLDNVLGDKDDDK